MNLLNKIRNIYLEKNISVINIKIYYIDYTPGEIMITDNWEIIRPIFHKFQ